MPEKLRRAMISQFWLLKTNRIQSFILMTWKGFNISIMTVVAIVAVAIAVLVAYSIGRGVLRSNYDELLDEIEDLKAKEKESAVVKRVSQQMEAIAYDQMNLSNQQRDRAEEQSRLAEANAAKAEEQSRLAQDNAQRAQQQSLLAERNAAEAEKAADDARKQRDAATYAKSISDTLSFRTLSRSLGTTSMAKFESNEDELGRILAYSSWYFADKYKGNPYQKETFKALMLATKEFKVYTIPRRSAVNSVMVLKGQRDGCVAVTNYGEVVLIEDGKMHMLLQDNNFDFRSVWLNERYVYALSYAGDLCVLDYEKLLTTVKLPSDHYVKILQIDASTLLCVAHRTLVWYDLKTKNVINSVIPSKKVSTAVRRNNKLLIFYTDGTYVEMDDSGNVTPMKKFAEGVVTSALHVESEGKLFLGMKDGDIVVITDDDNFFASLSGHIAQVTGLTYSNNTLVSSCYDREMLIWYLPKLKDTRAERNKNKSKGTPTEWLVPANYDGNAWGLSVSTKGIWAWLGLSDGRIVRHCISVPYMSKQVYSKIKRGLTMEEWMQYIGSNVEYVKIK